MATLSIYLLGTFQVTLEGQAVTAFATEKVRALLAYLGVEADRPHPRALLAHLLWPNQIERTALHNLRQALVVLRQAIGDRDADPPFLLITRQTIQFNPHSSYWLDVEALARLSVASQQPDPDQVEQWRQVADLYRGDFMAGLGLRDNISFEEWVVVRREQYYRQALEALDWLAGRYERQGEHRQAIHYARRQIALAPWQEQAHRRVMRCLAQDGQRSAALAQYESCRLLLLKELGVEPSEETTILYAQIRAGGLEEQETSTLSHKPQMEDKGAATDSLASLLPLVPRHNLPAQLTSFIGREKELAQIAAYLTGPDCRLLTLLGPGGMGKTRLALQAAARVASAFCDGVYLVSLDAVPRAELLASAIGGVLNLPCAERLTAYLRPREMLLVLDSFERFLSGADLLIDLLQAAPRLKIMITSQARLNLQAEWLMRVDALPFPASQAACSYEKSSDMGTWEKTLDDFSAVHLFVQRARQVEGEFSLSPETGPGVVRLCQLVEGMPLGIELAAAQVTEFSPAAIAHDVEANLERLATTRHDVPARHRSLSALFEHSWALLKKTEQASLQRLSVFQGEFDAQAAKAIANTTLADLTALVDKSMLWQTPTGRYAMHQLLRQRAAEKLQANPGQREAIHGQHCAYYATFMQQREKDLKSPRLEVLTEIDAEIENVRRAWQWAIAPGKAPSSAEIERAQVSLFQFYRARGALQEGLDVFGQAAERLRNWVAKEQRLDEARQNEDLKHKIRNASLLSALLRRQSYFAKASGNYPLAAMAAQQAVGQAQDRVDEAKGYIAWGQALCQQGRYDAAQAPLERALTLARAIHHPPGEASSLDLLADVYRRQGNHSQALECYRQVLAIYHASGQRHHKAQVLNALGKTHHSQSDYLTAQYHLEQARSICHAIGDELGEATTLNNLGALYSSLGDYRTGQGYYKQALIICKHKGYRAKQADNLEQLGLVYHHLGDPESARRYSEQALTLNREMGDRAGEGHSLTHLAHALAGQGNLQAAAAAYDQALHLWREIGQPDLALDNLAGLAHVALAQGDAARAVALVEEILAWTEANDTTFIEHLFQIYLICYRVLCTTANGNLDAVGRAQTLLATAYTELQARATSIKDETLRRRYLENIQAHRDIVREWQSAENERAFEGVGDLAVCTPSGNMS